tara:strand:+ start:1424 stop:2182 length:759 start_codon:yes stop_codon:yes gene_type:complete
MHPLDYPWFSKDSIPAPQKMEISHKGKRILVTGGSRGIGKKICDTFTRAGGNVISVNSKDFDFSTKEGLASFLDYIKTIGKIDILVNNAAYNFEQSVGELSEAEFDKLMLVNVKTPFFVTKEVSKVMKQNGYGRIINIASIAANRVKRGRSAYSASKASLITFTRVIASELAEYGILCNSVSPGFTLTEMTTKMLSKEQIDKHTEQVPLKKLADVEDIANIVSYLSSDLNKFITGQDIVVDGGFTNSIFIKN